MLLAGKGFTLIELLVSVSVISILGVITLINFREFSQDKILKKAEGQIQSLLRLAQANATSSTLCIDKAGVDWSIIFKTDGEIVELTCSATVPPTILQTLELENVKVSSVYGFTDCTGFVKLPLHIIYTKLSGQGKFIGSHSCIGKSSTLSIKLVNTLNNSERIFNISKGGPINVQ